MKAEALILLRENLEACRLVATWEVATDLYYAPKEERPNAHPEDPDITDEILHKWALVTGCHFDTAKRHGAMLWANDICYADGSTDATALGFVRNLIARDLPPPRVEL